MDYGKSFTLKLLEDEISTGDNIVFSYPAGTGKTTAIRDYMKSHMESRKIIYIAPTKSLLDDMYNALIEAGVIPNNIFNYHTSSEDYIRCLSHGKEWVNYEVDRRLKDVKIILITHERMKFDYYKRFVQIDDYVENKPLVFIDEAVEPCNIANMTAFNLENILVQSGLINPGDSVSNYIDRLIPDRILDNSRLINGVLTRPRYDKPNYKGKACILNLSELGIELEDTTGFSDSSDLLDPRVEGRFLNLYAIIAMQIAKGAWIENGNMYSLNLPIAVHLSWLKYAQCIVMDATAEITKSVYKDYRIVTSDTWNYDKLTNYVACHKLLSKSSISYSPEFMEVTFNQIPIHKYNKIYIVTFKDSDLLGIQSYVHNYCKENYPEYKIENYSSTNTLLSDNIDNSTDELYTNSDSVDKIIYITNYGRTRGSNVFRECDCLIQLGAYRLPGDIINIFQRLYPEMDQEELVLSNFIQELYRGRIRMDHPMDSYSIIDMRFHNYLKERLPKFKFQYMEFSDDSSKSIINTNLINEVYGINTDLVKLFIKAKNENLTLHKEDLFAATGLDRLNSVRERILNLYYNYPELKSGIFNKYTSIEDLQLVITSTKPGRGSNIDFKL